MPKSKKPWKAGSERAAQQKPYCPKSWQKKMDERRRMQALRERVKEAKEKIKQSKREAKELQKQREKLKEINKHKSTQYQVVRLSLSLFNRHGYRLKILQRSENGAKRQERLLKRCQPSFSTINSESDCLKFIRQDSIAMPLIN